MAYREQLHQSGDMSNGNGQRVPGEGGDDFGDDESEDILDEAFASQHQPMPHQLQHQPRHPGGGYDGNRHDRPFRRDQGGFRSRDRNDRDRNDRDRGGGDRDRGDRERGDRERPIEGRPPQPERNHEPVETSHEPRREPNHESRRDGGEGRRRDRFQQPHEQPEFLRRPVRRSRTEGEDVSPAPTKDEPSRD